MKNSQVFRCYVEKKKEFDVPAKSVCAELSAAVGIDADVRLFRRYDVQGVESLFDAKSVVLSDSFSDIVYDEQLPNLPESTRLIQIEPVAGQFDALSHSMEQNLQMYFCENGEERPTVKTAIVYAVGGVNESEFEQIKKYLVNPLEYRDASPAKPTSLLDSESKTLENIPNVEYSDIKNMGLAMSDDDVAAVIDYFKSEGRLPTHTEIMALDTYWSDHCRHTTFNTIFKSVNIEDSRVKSAYSDFLEINGSREPTLMNIATSAMRKLKKSGGLPMLDESDEINACTIKLGDKYLFFKNETHNHPTEIEPFGGASTCIGGGIRDPLSGRAHVYQGMRIIGAGDPRQDVTETLPGKLPQRKLALTAAEGFSSYCNQAGLSAGFCKEIYHPGYVAKRMEAGGLVAVAEMKNVKRIKPAKGDVVLLIGDRTGRDGVGGATGSSVAHNTDTVTEAACEVQKGNPQGGR
ncbi:MAG: phosphoribosylformylglycinamidine synthase, partial [Oscillospiraceae bacterium]|nr:phosphoribosylformylglycinamidine synthase [Oscillospiraceae bacterium]